MAKSKVQFDRWKAREVSSWTFQVFKSYALELDKLYWAHIPASKYVYKRLGESANWQDNVEKHFSFDTKKKSDLFANLKDWSVNYNEFDNWVNLNCIVALSSNLEVYMASIITLALESDIGILFGAAKKIDGVAVLKYGQASKIDFEQYVIACTKGEWPSRVSAYEKIFGTVPTLITSNIGKLEAIRKLRNKVGHAFGRDIEEAQKHGVKETLPMEKLSRERTVKYQKLVGLVAKSIDRHLMRSHVGEYQAINFYHRLYPSLRKDIAQYQRALILKKKIGEFGAMLVGKEFCKGLVNYYEAL